MPELPEVEVIKRGLEPFALHQKLSYSKFYRKDLRAPIPIRLIHRHFLGEMILSVGRRGKYLILETKEGKVFVHFGMSGQLLSMGGEKKPQLKHTHWVFGLSTDQGIHYFHYVDPRRFGLIDFQSSKHPITSHRFFEKLGVEPLDCRQLGDHLWKASRHKEKPIKNFIMDSHVVVGIGNIYASETLFKCGVHPSTAAGRLTKENYQAISRYSKKILRQAIQSGGTTLQDHRQLDGKPGYFRIKLSVYGKTGQPCSHCKKTNIEKLVLGGRSSFYCPTCQPLAK